MFNHKLINEPTDTEFLKDILENIENKSKVLDIGYGLGNEITYLSENYDMYGIELSDNFNNKYIHITHNILNKMPFPCSYFSGVYARLSLHYFTEEELLKIFKDINRILKKESYFKFSVKLNSGGFKSDKIIHPVNIWDDILENTNFEIINKEIKEGLLYNKKAKWVEYFTHRSVNHTSTL